MRVGIKLGIAGGVVAGLGTAAWTSDRVFNRGAETGMLVPATLGGAALGALALGVASRGGWRWAGSPALAGLATAGAPLGVAALGATTGLGLAVAFDQVFPGRDPLDPTPANAGKIRDEAARTAADAAVVEAKAAKELESANGRLDGALEELDAALDPVGGRLGAEGTIGEGRLDVTGLSPKQAAEMVFDAYAPGRDNLSVGATRVDGQNVFTLPWIKEGQAVSRDSLEQWFAEQVDTASPKGTLSAEEARRWQLGERRETLTRGEEGGS